MEIMAMSAVSSGVNGKTPIKIRAIYSIFGVTMS
jgi:hypothetical protein